MIGRGSRRRERFDPVQRSFIRDTIADVEALEVSGGERGRIYAGNAHELLRLPAHTA